MLPVAFSSRGPSLLRAALVFAMAAVGCRSQARAELAWKQRVVELQAEADSTVLEARFPFTNTGVKAIDVTQVESSCGCTVVSLEKRHYEPHESGEIVAKYTVSSQAGEQTKTVQVETNDGQPPTVLTLSIHVPQVLSIQPPFLVWRHGELPNPKTISVEVAKDFSAKDVSVQSSAVGFVAGLVPLVPGRKYELTVHPQSTDQHQFSTLVIRCHFGDQEKFFRAYATVRARETGE